MKIEVASGSGTKVHAVDPLEPDFVGRWWTSMCRKLCFAPAEVRTTEVDSLEADMLCQSSGCKQAFERALKVDQESFEALAAQVDKRIEEGMKQSAEDAKISEIETELRLLARGAHGGYTLDFDDEITDLIAQMGPVAWLTFCDAAIEQYREHVHKWTFLRPCGICADGIAKLATVQQGARYIVENWVGDLA